MAYAMDHGRRNSKLSNSVTNVKLMHVNNTALSCVFTVVNNALHQHTCIQCTNDIDTVYNIIELKSAFLFARTYRNQKYTVSMFFFSELGKNPDQSYNFM